MATDPERHHRQEARTAHRTVPFGAGGRPRPDLVARSAAPLQRTAGNTAVRRVLQGDAPVRDLVSEEHEAGERAAEAAGQDLAGGRDPGPVAQAPRVLDPPCSPLTEHPGAPMPEDLRRAAERTLGAPLGHVRVHASEDDRAFVGRLGARAATHGGAVFLGPGESMSDRRLLGHELAHVVHQQDGRLHLRRATWVERRAWLASYDHPLPRRFLNHYMDDTGAPIVLGLRDMADCNAVADIRRSADFAREVARLAGQGGGSAAIRVKGWGGAMTNGTLGNFTITWTGAVVVRSAADWEFTGTMDFFDYWDFDPKPFGRSGRPAAAEIKVRLAAYGLPGRPFEITSVAAPVRQSSADPRAQWGTGSAPRPVGDRASRTGADIAVGDVAGGPVGAEVGANASEDLNR